MAQSLVTLNRTLAVQVDKSEPGGATRQVVKMQAFTGNLISRNTRQGQAQVTYKVSAIHLPEHVIFAAPVEIDFAASAVVATQEVLS